MRKQYIQPNTTIQKVLNTTHVCVGSVRGGGFQYGGGGTGHEPI